MKLHMWCVFSWTQCVFDGDGVLTLIRIKPVWTLNEIIYLNNYRKELFLYINV